MKSDQEYARVLLEGRAKGYSWQFLFGKNAMRYVVLVAVFIVLSLLVMLLRADEFVWLLVGMFGGCILRDIAWFRAARGAWPFNLKALDWDKVQRLANGETVA